MSSTRSIAWILYRNILKLHCCKTVSDSFLYFNKQHKMSKTVFTFKIFNEWNKTYFGNIWKLIWFRRQYWKSDLVKFSLSIMAEYKIKLSLLCYRSQIRIAKLYFPKIPPSKKHCNFALLTKITLLMIVSLIYLPSLHLKNLFLI